MDLVQDFICKFEEDPIKTEGSIVSTTFFQCSRAGNSEVNGWDVSGIRTHPNFMAVLVTCKTDDDPIKNEGAICVHNIFSIISL